MTRWRLRQRDKAAFTVKTAQPRAAISLLRRNGEAGITHSEGNQDSSIQHGAQWGALEACDQESQQVGRETVVKPRAWMVDQRHRRQACNPRVGRQRVVDLS